jgi:hypothetical protein
LNVAAERFGNLLALGLAYVCGALRTHGEVSEQNFLLCCPSLSCPSASTAESAIAIRAKASLLAIAMFNARTADWTVEKLSRNQKRESASRRGNDDRFSRTTAHTRKDTARR